MLEFQKSISLIIQRTYSLNLANQSIHLKNYLNPVVEWRTKAELLQLVINNIIYNQDGIIAINKPANLSISRTGIEGNDVKHPEELSLLDVSEDLCDHLKCKSLIVVKSLIKYYSGITLFSTTKQMAERLRKSLDFNRSQKLFNQNFWAICLGIPHESGRTESMHLKSLETTNQYKSFTWTRDPTNNDIKRGLVHHYSMKYDVLDQNKDLNVSLINLSPSSIKRWSANIYLSQKLCPILGDHFYSHQVKHLNMGNILTIPEEYSYKPQVLPHKVKSILLNTFANAQDIPTMLHSKSLVLPHVERDREIRIECQPPPSFKNVCNLFELKVEAN